MCCSHEPATRLYHWMIEILWSAQAARKKKGAATPFVAMPRFWLPAAPWHDHFFGVGSRLMNEATAPISASLYSDASLGRVEVQSCVSGAATTRSITYVARSLQICCGERSSMPLFARSCSIVSLPSALSCTRSTSSSMVLSAMARTWSSGVPKVHSGISSACRAMSRASSRLPRSYSTCAWKASGRPHAPKHCWLRSHATSPACSAPFARCPAASRSYS
mmetsp:Transcript_19749/g.29552  ORF Transcript_19749/g.29552 Transcript_19749/m.29552 type:complete len:220 (-) Transcript_19749:7-666(-)